VPKGLTTSGTLTLRTAQDLISELLNPATSSNPANEIASDWLVVKREAENVRSDANTFQAIWDHIFGVTVGVNACLTAYGAPTLTSADECLNSLNTGERRGNFAQAASYRDEDGFRQLVVKDNDAIAMVTLLGSVMTQQTPLLVSQLSAFDGDLASLRADMNTLAGNEQAIQDATDLLNSLLSDSPPSDSRARITKAQIKARLIQTLNGGTKPVLDDAELNKLTDDYYDLIKTGAGRRELDRARDAIRLLWFEGVRQTLDELAFATTLATPAFPNTVTCSNIADEGRILWLGCYADQIGSRYSFVLDRDHLRLNRELPRQVEQINIKQSNLLARANEIYDNSEVTVPLDKAIDLGGNTGNLRVYFTLYETETFPRFAIPPSTTTNPVIAATPVAPAPAVPPAQGTNPAPAQPSGTPVTSGMFEVHDRYKATIVAAFAFSPNLKEGSIKTMAVTTGMATGSTTQNPIPCTTAAPCTQVVSTSGPAHSSVIVGLSYHLWGYDTFPGAYSWKKPTQALKQAFGIFGGLSVQNLNDYYAGVDFQIAHGLQLIGGANIYRQSSLAPGFTTGGIYPGTPDFTGPQRWTKGAYFGLGLNLSIFRKAFGSVTGLGTKTATSGS
jgi:hypothetical protein